MRLVGHWSLQGEVPSIADVQAQVDAGPRPQRLAFDARGLTSWDSGLLMVVRAIADLCAQRHIAKGQNIRKWLFTKASEAERENICQDDA